MSTMTDAKAWSGTETLLAWIEFRHKDSGGASHVYYWSGVTLTDASSYYGGEKEARVLSFGEITMNLSDSRGQMQINTCRFTLSDLPDDSGNMLLRGFLGSAYQIGLTNVEVVIRLVTDTDRRAAVAPTTVFRGVVVSYRADNPYTFTFECEDWFGSKPQLSVSPPVVTLTDFPNAPAWSVGRRVPIIYGELSDEADADPRGLCPVIPVGTFVALDSTVWQGFLVAAHACKSIVNGYITTTTPTHTTFTWNTTNWMRPDDAGFAALFGTKYYDGPSGQRYTLVYGTDNTGIDATPRSLASASPLYTLTLNVQGVEATGDASGSLLTSIYDQIGHLADNYVLPATAYAGGAWGSTPTWLDTTPKRSTAAFATAKTAAAGVMLAGDGSAFMLNAPENARDLLADLAVSGDCDLSINRDGQLAIYVEDGSASVVSTFTESDHILADSFGFLDDGAGLFNVAACYFAPTYLGSLTPTEIIDDNLVTRFPQGITQEDGLSQYLYGRRIQAADVSLRARRVNAEAADVLRRRLSRMIVPPRTVAFDIGAHHILSDGLSAGDMVSVTHRQGPSATGYSGKHMQVRRMRVALDTMRASLECQDLTVVDFGNESYNAGKFVSTGGAGDNWNVDAGDVMAYRYRIVGNKMQVDVVLTGTQVFYSITNPTGLTILLPDGKTASETKSFASFLTYENQLTDSPRDSTAGDNGWPITVTITSGLTTFKIEMSTNPGVDPIPSHFTGIGGPWPTPILGMSFSFTLAVV